MKRRWAPLALLILAAACLTSSTAAKQQSSTALQQACGGLGQLCCARCPPGTLASECDVMECTGGRACYMFASKEAAIPDGTRRFPQVCLDTPPACGQAGQPCCFSSDPTAEAERCGPGLTCIVEGVGYGGTAMFTRLTANPGLVRSGAVMGTCRKLSTATCGKRWYPCGAAARRIGCAEKELLCGPQDYCASPADTMLGAPRCLPLPPRCGSKNNGCCPPNKDGVVRERWLLDPTQPVPYCTDGASFCVWKVEDYKQQGLTPLNSGGGARSLTWDGYFQRGYGTSRCAPLPPACGNPGEPCCPSMIDQRISGMVHNRRFKYQPCNYAAAGKVGIYCRGNWQAALLFAGGQIGTCTLNTPDCGTLGKQCCREDVPEVGPVTRCEVRQPAGTHYCNAANVCSRCPAVPTTPEQKADCRAPARG